MVTKTKQHGCILDFQGIVRCSFFGNWPICTILKTKNQGPGVCLTPTPFELVVYSRVNKDFSFESLLLLLLLLLCK